MPKCDVEAVVRVANGLKALAALETIADAVHDPKCSDEHVGALVRTWFREQERLTNG